MLHAPSSSPSSWLTRTVVAEERFRKLRGRRRSGEEAGERGVSGMDVSAWYCGESLKETRREHCF